MPRPLVVAGHDKLGRRLVAALAASKADVDIALCRTRDLRRLFKALSRGRVSVAAVLHMAWAELLRSDRVIGSYPVVHSDTQLAALVSRLEPDVVYLFRAGVVVSQTTIAAAAPMFNIHCAKLPEYAGLGALWRALNDNAFFQQASLHRISATIDGGEVVATLDYHLDPAASYRANEDAAYGAGIRLLYGALNLPVVPGGGG